MRPKSLISCLVPSALVALSGAAIAQSGVDRPAQQPRQQQPNNQQQQQQRDTMRQTQQRLDTADPQPHQVRP